MSKPVNQTSTNIPPTILPGDYQATEKSNYATIIRRFFAYQIDLIILLFVSTCISILFSNALGYDAYFVGQSIAAGWFGASGWIIGVLSLFIPDNSEIVQISIIINLIFNWLYFTLLESSKLKATFGKNILGIKVNNSKNQQISFKQANIRYWGKLISTFMFMIGFLMIMLNEKKQSFHDMIAKTTVIYK